MDSSPEIPPAIDRETIAAAQRRIAADVRRTPLWRLPGAALGLDVAELWLKLEQLHWPPACSASSRPARC